MPCSDICHLTIDVILARSKRREIVQQLFAPIFANDFQTCSIKVLIIHSQNCEICPKYRVSQCMLELFKQMVHTVADIADEFRWSVHMVSFENQAITSQHFWYANLISTDRIPLNVLVPTIEPIILNGTTFFCDRKRIY